MKSFPESEKYLYGLDLWVVDCVRYNLIIVIHILIKLYLDKQIKPKKTILTFRCLVDYKDLLSKCPANVEPAYDGLVLI